MIKNMINGEEGFSIDVKKGMYYGKERVKVVIKDTRTGESMDAYISDFNAMRLADLIREKNESKDVDFDEKWE